MKQVGKWADMMNRRCDSFAQDKAEARVRQMEVRAEEQRKAKQAADSEWRKQQRLRELQRAEVHGHQHACISLKRK